MFIDNWVNSEEETELASVITDFKLTKLVLISWRVPRSLTIHLDSLEALLDVKLAFTAVGSFLSNQDEVLKNDMIVGFRKIQSECTLRIGWVKHIAIALLQVLVSFYLLHVDVELAKDVCVHGLYQEP